jgi:uncharacterized membrane protein YbaN (DUF454 family)
VIRTARRFNIIAMARVLYNIAGCISVGLGFLGLFLPLLPTTPFLLLAALCFSRGSERLHAWLIGHPQMGPIIRDWNEHRTIRPRVKLAAAITLVVLMAPALLFGNFPPALKAVSAFVGLGVIVTIYRQRSR